MCGQREQSDRGHAVVDGRATSWRPQAHRPMTLGKLSERRKPPALRGRMPLVDGGAHTVLPLFPGLMIRRSSGSTLGTPLALISPQPRPRAVSPSEAIGGMIVSSGNGRCSTFAPSHGAHPLARESLPSPNILV